MTDYLVPYEDMSIFTFATYKELVEWFISIVCNEMDFVLVLDKAKQKNPVRTPVIRNGKLEGYYKTNETYYFLENSNDKRSFILISEGVSDWFGISIKIKKEDKYNFYHLVKPFLQATEEGGGPPCVNSIDEAFDYLHNKWNGEIDPIETDLKTCGLI